MPKVRSVTQAGAVVFRMNGRQPEILVVAARRSRGAWIFPKGHVEKDESLESAALREAQEEAGVIGRIVATLSPPLVFESDKERIEVQYYVVEKTGQAKRYEDREQQWLPFGKALETLTHESARDLLRKARPHFRGD